MDRMNPPPNYYGAMYPNQNTPMNNSPFQNGNNMTSPPPFTEENSSAFKVAKDSDTSVQDGYVPDSYIRIEEGIAGVKKFYENFKNLISEKIGTRVTVPSPIHHYGMIKYLMEYY